MANYQLSLEAENDIAAVFEYGIMQFGFEQALDYHNALETHFTEMAKNPLHYMKVDHISLGSRRSVFRVHSIYFCLTEHGIFIERVIGRQNFNT